MSSVPNTSRHLLNPKSRLDSGALADLYAKYKDDPAAADLMRLWWEVDALRFELAAADERTAVARQERKNIEDRYYRLQLRAVRGGPV
jgi:hypothetical protein